MTHAFANGHLLGPNYFLQRCFPATLQVDVTSVLGSFSPGLAKTKWHATKCFKHSSLTCLLPCIVDSRWISILFKNPVWQLGLWGMLSLSQRSMCTFHNICLTSLQKPNYYFTSSCGKRLFQTKRRACISNESNRFSSTIIPVFSHPIKTLMNVLKAATQAAARLFYFFFSDCSDMALPSYGSMTSSAQRTVGLGDQTRFDRVAYQPVWGTHAAGCRHDFCLVFIYCTVDRRL